jgi:hypothetical protein
MRRKKIERMPSKIHVPFSPPKNGFSFFYFLEQKNEGRKNENLIKAAKKI